MLLSGITITPLSSAYEAFYSLYQESFPPEEQLPIPSLMNDYPENNLIACYEKSVFCGFYATLTLKDITHILFLAVDPSRRNRGYGSQILSLIAQRFPKNRLILDIEAEDMSAPNNNERIHRKAFYEKNGYQESGIQYIWHGVPYKIMIKHGSITEQEFDDFWEYLADLRKNDL